MKEFKADKLTVKIYETREKMGVVAAQEAAEAICKMLKEKETLTIVFAAAPSQNEFLAALVAAQNIDWQRITALHMDEYVGLPENAPQGFGNFLRKAIWDKLPFGKILYLYNDTLSPEENCKRYETVLAENPIDLVFMGIGENGHIAFNDPHVAFFDDAQAIKIVDLDLACRQQQVNDGCFGALEEVPTHALTLTIPTLMSAKQIFCIVPSVRKSQAVKAAVEGKVATTCPASVLRTHNNAALYIDKDAANQLTVK